MILSTIWSRRAFVVTASQLGIFQIGKVQIAEAAVIKEDDSQIDMLVATCVGLSCPQSLGDECRRVLGLTASSMSRVAAELLQELRSLGRDCGSAPAMLDFLRVQSRRDFAAAKIIFVDGWVLSRTEARAYAIAVTGHSELL